MGKLGYAKKAKPLVTALMVVDTSGTPERLGGYYTNTTIAFVDSGPDTLTDTDNLFLSKMLKAGMRINISGSTSNDGNYTIASVVAGTITLIAGDSLTAEIAGDTIVITPLARIFCKSIDIQVPEGNTGNGAVGDSNVDRATGQGVEVTPLNAYTKEGVYLDDLWIDAVTAEALSISYEEVL